jgi:hypothetical protein
MFSEAYFCYLVAKQAAQITERNVTPLDVK